MAAFRLSNLTVMGATLIAMGAAVAFAAPATAKISAMSGAYDGRGKPPEIKPAQAAQPKKAKKSTSKPATAPGGN